MAPKKNYSRYFIILQEDEKGFSLDTEKSPSGYVKLEKKNNKCKISYYAQNLSMEKQPYHLILVCNKKDVKIVPDPSRMRPIDVDVLQGDCSKFKKETGWEPEIPFEKTMEDLLDYWRERVK